MYFTRHWVVQWSRVQTLDDVVELLRAINPTFDPNFPGLTPGVMRLCDLQDKPKHNLEVFD